MWTDEINFYLDGTSFQHKFNPKDQARGPHGKEWRKPSEGLKKDYFKRSKSREWRKSSTIYSGSLGV